jgi:hypothetical protein
MTKEMGHYSKIPAIVLERIETSHPARAHFLMTEAEDWPDGSLDALERCGLFQVSDFAEAIVCPGCDWQCHKAISVRKTTEGQVRAYIVCDEEPDLGLTFISDDERCRYHTSLSRLANLIADQLGKESPEAFATGTEFLLGIINGRHGARKVCLTLEDGRLRLRVGRQAVLLVDVLSWDGEDLAIDKTRLRQLAGRKIATPRSTKSDRSRQQQRTRTTALRNRAILREANRLRTSNGESWPTIATAIARTNLAKASSGRPLSPDTVRRIVAELQKNERK